MNSVILSQCEGAYQRTLALWKSLEGRYPTWKCRYSILYAPPVEKPDLLIIGANPGYDPTDLYDDEILKWPEENEFIVKDWPLARKLRRVFSDAELPNLLKNSIGTNLLFFKSKSLGRHESGLGWADNPPTIRTLLENHCREELAGLIQALAPKAILTLGLSVFDNFVEGDVQSISSHTGRRIAAVGQTGNIRTMGIIHPTGAQVSHADWGVVSSSLADTMNGRLSGVEPFSVTPPSAPAPRVEKRSKPTSGSRQPTLRPTTIVKAAGRPPGSFGYQPFQDFWQELSKLGPTSIKDFHAHMVSMKWRRPQGKALTYDVTRTDLASMCKHGFAERVHG